MPSWSCNAFHFVFLGTVKKCALLKIVHDKYNYKKKTIDDNVTEFWQSFDNAIAANKEIQPLLNKTQASLFSLAYI